MSEEEKEETPEDRRKRVEAALGRGPEGFTPECLQRLADGPIMNANEIYLPAGRLSMDEYRARERRNILDSSE